ncbi:PREDICTED: acidic mammalian chitinase-like [Lupinus angustifolius]|uniref:acidic mammalian chitinase-like n=1 Tax=Lupinus angustifolius TaxID=3871 RepID=UPI00092E44EB|nr:PREDICTED: acidic mammalian chitinase-like [Lupinus angustifolius]
MAESKSLSLLFFTMLVGFSSAQTAIKGGYWYSESGLKVSDIDASHFTHLFCAFAILENNKVSISSSDASSFSTFTQTLLQKKSSIKTLLSIGGGKGPSLAKSFSDMASQASTRKSFIDSSIQVARNNNFHGLDLDWEYPSTGTDKTNLGLLVKEWRAAITQESKTSGKPALLLSAAVAGSDQITSLQNYPGQELANNLDFLNVMTYDLFTSDGYPMVTQPPAPLKNPGGQFSVDEGITKWINQLGLPPKKLALGLPFYGFKWLLSDPIKHALFAQASAGAGAVKYKDIKNAGGQVVYNSTYFTNYSYKGTDWYGYDDTQSVSAKVDYAKGKGLFGYFAWHIEQDSNWALSQAASQAWGSQIDALQSKFTENKDRELST